MNARSTLFAGLLSLSSLTAASPSWAWLVNFEAPSLDGELFRSYARRFEANVQSDDLVKLTIVGGADLRVYDLFRYASGPLRGQALIDWDWQRQTNTVGTTLLFSRPVESVSLDAGDWGSDDDSPLELTAMDCNGTVLHRTSVSWTIERNPPFARLSVQAAGICRVVYRSGGQYPGSTFIDNVRFE